DRAFQSRSALFSRLPCVSENAERNSSAATPARVRGEKIIAGHMRKAPEVYDIGKLFTAGRKLFVATGGDIDLVANRDGLRRLLPELDERSTIAPAVVANFDRAALICT